MDYYCPKRIKLVLFDPNLSNFAQICLIWIVFIAEYEEEIPFVNPAPIDEEEAKKAAKKQKNKKDKE